MSKTFMNFVDNMVFKNTIPDDMISYSTCYKIIGNKYFQNLTNSIGNKYTCINILYLTINTSIFLYEYTQATWFFLYFMTPSGFKIIKKLIYSNPIYILFFYLSFYIKVLTEPDIEKLNAVSNTLGLPTYEYASGVRDLVDLSYDTVTTLVNNICEKYEILIPKENTVFILTILKNISKNIISSKVENIGDLLVLSSNKIKVKDIPKEKAIYKLDIDSEVEILLWSEEIYKNMRNYYKEIKKQFKTKRERKLALQKIVELKNEEGKVKCLEKCEKRIKTSNGCYCEGGCGSLL